MQNCFVFNPFWRHHNGIDGYDDWEARFKASARSFALALRAGDTARVLSLVFDRLYMLRNHAQTRSDIDRIMRRKVIPLLCEYFHEDWEKVIAILGDTGQGGFIERKQLPVPPGLDDLAGDPRWRYIVRAEFAADAYAALGQ